MTYPLSVKRILLVDDERVVRSLLATSLEDLEGDFLIETASSGADALNKIEQNEIDLVITDYQMPVMDGIELTQKIRALSPQTRIILMSAYDSLSLQEEVLGVIHLDGYLEKPTTFDKLSQVIHAAIENESPAKL